MITSSNPSVNPSSAKSVQSSAPFERPRPKLEHLPLERLLFPPECQQRAGLPTELPTDARLRESVLGTAARNGCALRIRWSHRSLLLLWPITRVCCSIPSKWFAGRAKRNNRNPASGSSAGSLVERGTGFTGRSRPCRATFMRAGLRTPYSGVWPRTTKTYRARGHGSARRAVETLLDTPAAPGAPAGSSAARGRRVAPGDSPRVPSQYRGWSVRSWPSAIGTSMEVGSVPASRLLTRCRICPLWTK